MRNPGLKYPTRLPRSQNETKGGPAAGPPLAWRAAAAVLFLTSLAFAQNKPAGYAGSDSCSTCHEDISKAFQKNPHHVVESVGKGGWKGMACEACHGPGAKHAETATPEEIRNPAKLAVEQADRLCLKCHLNETTHVGRISSGHAKNQVACVECHSVHKGQDQLRPSKAEAINKQCARCHLSAWAQFQKPYHHRLPEGAMSCVDCHNPHGSSRPRMLQTAAANEPGCFKCHGDIRGPFTYEHAPVKFEGCTACHEPHGSANPRMLTRHEVRFVCLECHSNIAAGNRLGGIPPAFHNLNSTRFRNCTICHQKIHGSYVDASLER